MSGLASLILAFLAALNPTDIETTQRYLFTASALCFVIATYRIWINEHKKVVLLQEQIDKSLTPQLIPEGALLAAGVASNGTETQTALTLRLDIFNLGMPSIVKGWRLRVNTPAKGSFLASPVFLEGRISLPDVSGKGGIELSDQDYIFKKTETPIPTGGKASGFLIFFIPFQIEEICTQETTAQLIFKDVKNQSYSLEITGFINRTPTSDTVGYYPSIQMERIQEKPKTHKKKK